MQFGVLSNSKNTNLYFQQTFKENKEDIGNKKINFLNQHIEKQQNSIINRQNKNKKINQTDFKNVKHLQTDDFTEYLREKRYKLSFGGKNFRKNKEILDQNSLNFDLNEKDEPIMNPKFKMSFNMGNQKESENKSKDLKDLRNEESEENKIQRLKTNKFLNLSFLNQNIRNIEKDLSDFNSKRKTNEISIPVENILIENLNEENIIESEHEKTKIQGTNSIKLENKISNHESKQFRRKSTVDVSSNIQISSLKSSNIIEDNLDNQIMDVTPEKLLIEINNSKNKIQGDDNLNSSNNNSINLSKNSVNLLKENSISLNQNSKNLKKNSLKNKVNSSNFIPSANFLKTIKTNITNKMVNFKEEIKEFRENELGVIFDKDKLDNYKVIFENQWTVMKAKNKFLKLLQTSKLRTKIKFKSQFQRFMSPPIKMDTSIDNQKFLKKRGVEIIKPQKKPNEVEDILM